MLIASIIMLLIVLVVGSSVNGASRWIALGPLRIQPAELTAVAVLLPREPIWCVRLMRCEIPRAALKPMGVILVLWCYCWRSLTRTVVVLFVTTLAMRVSPGRNYGSSSPHRMGTGGDL